MKTTCFVLKVIASVSLSSAVCAQTPEAPAASPPAAAPAASAAAPQKLTPDQMVLSKMHETNQMEIKAGEMAKEKGSSEKMRSFGERLRLDHQFADQKVTALAGDLGIQLVKVEPQTPEQKQQHEMQMQMIQQLQQAQGSGFDQQFAAAMKKGHEQAIAILRAATPQLAQQKVISLIERMTPILQQHETLAEHLGEAASNK